MKNRNGNIEQAIALYEGLIFATAVRYVDRVEPDLEDLQQLLRIKVWKALEKYDPALCRTSRNSWVFGAIRNETKDWLRYKRPRPESSIEGMTELTASSITGQVSNSNSWRRDHFEGEYLSADHDETFRDIEDEPPLIPSTLSELELKVVCLLYRNYRQTEIASYLAVEKREVEKAMRHIRMKMADWSPDVADRLCPMPIAGAGDRAGEPVADAI